MATMIATYLEAVTREAALARSGDAKQKADKAKSFYAARRDEYVAHCGCSLDEIETMERHGTCGRVGMHSLYAEYLDASNAESLARNLQEIADRTKPRAACIKLQVSDSYSVKGALKSMGYTYDRAGYWADVLGTSTKPAWIKNLPVDHETIAREVNALVALGVACKVAGPMATVLANTINQAR